MLRDSLEHIVSKLKDKGFKVVTRDQEMLRPGEVIVDIESATVDEHFTGGLKLAITYAILFIDTDRYSFLDTMQTILELFSDPLYLSQDVEVVSEGEYVIGMILLRKLEVLYYG